MARIFAGELSMIDQEVFDVLKQLPDDFWVFAEFNIGRNIDWFIIRPENPSTLILTELKRVSRPLRGAVNGLWEKQDAAGEWEEMPANSTDANPYWQAVNSANALADWLWNNQQLYRETADIRPSAEFRVWPDLLLLSPQGVIHRLPLAPPSRYGRWWFSMDEWMRHVRGWTPRSGVSLHPREVANLVEALRLTEIWSGGDGMMAGASVPYTSTPSNEPLSFGNWLQTLEQRVSQLERELAILRSDDSQQAAASDDGAADEADPQTGNGATHEATPLSER